MKSKVKVEIKQNKNEIPKLATTPKFNTYHASLNIYISSKIKVRAKWEKIPLFLEMLHTVL